MCVLARGFSRQHRITEFTSSGYASPLRNMAPGFTWIPPYRFAPVLPLTGTATFLRHPIAYLLPEKIPRSRPTPFPEGISHRPFGWLVPLLRHGRPHTGTGISTRCPSTTPVGLALGPDSPWADWPGPGTLGLSAGKVLTCLIATHACILTPPPSTTGSLRGFTR